MSTLAFEGAESVTDFPSTATMSEEPARSPSFARRPLTLTRPASIQPSISRREPSPAVARRFCNRSAVGAGCGLGLLVGFFFGTDSRFRGGWCGFKRESLGDFLERRQLFQGTQAKVVEELAGRRIQRRPARGFAVANDVNPAACLEGLD